MSRVKVILAIICVLSLSLISLNVFAKDDISVDVSTSLTQICSSDTPFNSGFCGYNYFIISTENNVSGFQCRAYDSNHSQIGSTVVVSYISSYFVFDNIEFSATNISSISCRITSSGSGTFILTDNAPRFPTGSMTITENGTYDVINYATASVNVPTQTVVSDLPPFVDTIMDSFWQYHVAFAAAIVPLIAIFLVYRLLKGRLR